MPKKDFFDDPEQNRWFNAAMARSRRRKWYRRVLGQRLRAIAPLKSRKTDSEQYIKLLERAFRHEVRIRRETNKDIGHMLTMPPRLAKPFLRLVRGGKSIGGETETL